MPLSSNTTTPIPNDYSTPPFPSLYWLIGTPHVKKDPVYLYRVRDVWRFTLYWTLIVYEGAHLAVALYAVAIVWLGSRKGRKGLGMGRTQALQGSESRSRKVRHGIGGTGISGMWFVPLVYALVAGVEAILAGTFAGLLIGAIYNAGTFKISTWIPFVWSLINLLVLIVSSFSIQGGL